MKIYDIENFNLTKFGETMMKRTKQGQREHCCCSHQIPPLFNWPNEKNLINCNCKKHEAFTNGRILIAAIMDLVLSAHDAFKF